MPRRNAARERAEAWHTSEPVDGRRVRVEVWPPDRRATDYHSVVGYLRDTHGRPLLEQGRQLAEGDPRRTVIRQELRSLRSTAGALRGAVEHAYRHEGWLHRRRPVIRGPGRRTQGPMGPADRIADYRQLIEGIDHDHRYPLTQADPGHPHRREARVYLGGAVAGLRRASRCAAQLAQLDGEVIL